MNKEDFTKFLNESLKGFPLEKQIQIIEKMKAEWIPKIVIEKTKNYVLCEHCGRYSLEKNNKKTYNREKRIQSTYTDAGYGDDDLYGEVEYIVEYSICPHCLKKKEISKSYMGTNWEKDKYGRLVR